MTYSRKDRNSTNYVHPSELNLWEVHRAMDYDSYGQPVLRIDDTTKQHTSHNRVKTSNVEIIDYASFPHSIQSDVWDTQTIGTTSVEHDTYLSMVKMQVGSSVGDRITRQTKRVIPYVPGRMNEVSMTMIFGVPTVGVRRRFGVFDDACGMFFEDAGDGNYYCVLRRTTAEGVVEERVAREDWNGDKLDGNGPSGFTANPLNIQHMVIEYEWYGAGQIEFKFVIDNNSHYIHRFNTANNKPHTSLNSAFLPVRVEIENYGGTAGTHDFYQGSHAVGAEGTLIAEGRLSSISNALAGVTLTTANTFYPLVAIRLKSTYLDGIVMPQAYAGATLDNTNFFLRIIENPVITGGTWVSYGDESPVEYNITATGFTGGDTLQTVFTSPGNQGNIFQFNDATITQLFRTTTTTIGDTSSTFLIAGASVNANKKGWANLRWISIR